MKNHLVVMLIQWYRIAATLFALMWKLHKMLGKIVLLEMELNREIKVEAYRRLIIAANIMLVTGYSL